MRLDLSEWHTFMYTLSNLKIKWKAQDKKRKTHFVEEDKKQYYLNRSPTYFCYRKFHYRLADFYFNTCKSFLLHLGRQVANIWKKVPTRPTKIAICKVSCKSCYIELCILSFLLLLKLLIIQYNFIWLNITKLSYRIILP